MDKVDIIASYHFSEEQKKIKKATKGFFYFFPAYFYTTSRGNFFRIFSAILVLLSVSACDRSKPPLRVFPDMDDQKIVKPQTRLMLPVEGTIARGQKPYPYKGKPDEAEKKLTNPLTSTTDVLHRGQFMFNVYCMPCHNIDGKGMGPVVKHGFAPPPPLDSDRVKQWKDGRIFHIITEGQGIMPSYSAQVDPIDRWAIVRYIRVLQNSHSEAPKFDRPEESQGGN